jgi:hypothetical protein
MGFVFVSMLHLIGLSYEKKSSSSSSLSPFDSSILASSFLIYSAALCTMVGSDASSFSNSSFMASLRLLDSPSDFLFIQL